MNLSVRDMLKIPNCTKMQVVAGESGMDNMVSTVSVMDAPDIHRWLKGGEFLITSGYPLRGDPRIFERLISNIHKRGAAAFGIKLGRFIKELPPGVERLANELSLPIIKIPLDYAFTDIINPVLMDIIDRQSRRLLFSERIHDEFTRLVIEGKDISQILDTLSEIIGKHICYVDDYFGGMYFSSGANVDVFSQVGEEELFYGREYYPVDIDSRIYGYILILEKFGDIGNETYEETAINHASTVIKLCIQKEISNRQVEEKYRDEFVQDLILKNIKSEEELVNRAAVYGWKHGKRAFAIIADIDDFKSRYTGEMHENKQLEMLGDKITSDIIKKYRTHFGNHIMYKTFSDNVIFIISEKEEKNTVSIHEKIRKTGISIAESVGAKFGYTITTGVGEIKTLLSLDESFKEAKRAIKIGKKGNGNGSVAYYKNLGSYILIEQACKSEYALQFYNEYVQPIIEYDLKSGSELLKTLQVIIESDWNLKEASEALYIHYNTMKYRFDRIGKISGVDFSKNDEKFNMSLALKMMEMSDSCT